MIESVGDPLDPRTIDCRWLSSDGHATTLSDDEVKAVLKKHIVDQVRHFNGDIRRWDVPMRPSTTVQVKRCCCR